MINLELTAEEILRYLQEVELPERRSGALGDVADEIMRYGAFVGSSVECHPYLQRAMDHGRRYIDSLEKSGKAVPNGRIIVAETLTGPKGRFTRNWHAPRGGLWGCLLHANTLTPRSTMLLSLAVGIAACEAVRLEIGGNKTFLRWVNDVLIEGVKVAGFLIESYTGPRWGEQFHLVGFGINVNNRDFPGELRDIATSLRNRVAKEIDLKGFSLNFIAKLAWNIGLLYFVEARQTEWLQEDSSFSHPIIERWKELSDIVGQKVVFGHDVINSPQYSAVITGISPDGGLQMTLDDGSVVTEHSGEIRFCV
ncbi:biotin--[acetyl-CoA-carboxylase] ligase [Desulfopila inferna]|nr:biotin--[acetyl-CoA-carboxylase] ligase [Desulfopila inferna]